PLIGAAERERYQAWQGERVEPAPVESLVAAFDLRASLQPQAPALLDARGSPASGSCLSAAMLSRHSTQASSKRPASVPSWSRRTRRLASLPSPWGSTCNARNPP
ncbi:hypothetical protein ACV35Z_37080, partial [Pseudomonas aeruginosa]